MKSINYIPLFIGAAMLLAAFFITSSSTIKQAAAQPETSLLVKQDVIVLPLELGRDTSGIVMIDLIGQNLWIYEIDSKSSVHNRLKLLAARNWKYDRLLQQYNTAEPLPSQVKALLENLGKTPETPANEEQNNNSTGILDMAQPDKAD